MFESIDPNSLIYKKAFEVSYALLRVAQHVKSKSLSDQIEERAAKLLSFITEGDYRSAELSLTATEYLIRLCTETGFLHPANSQLLLNEVKFLRKNVADKSKVKKMEDLETIFTQRQEAEKESFADWDYAANNPAILDYDSASETVRQPAGSAIGSAIPEIDSAALEDGSAMNFPEEINPANDYYNNHGGEEGETIYSANTGESGAQIRQRIIFEKIGESGNCRFSDIVSILPDSSERTIRYDLQSLVERGSIEKVGISGPSVSYRLKQNELSGLPVSLESLNLAN